MKLIYYRIVLSSFILCSVFLLSCEDINNRNGIISEQEPAVEQKKSVFKKEEKRYPEHRVYLWDVSESLNENKMWDTLKNAITQAIKEIPENPNNKISIITFYSEPFHEVLNVKADADGKADLLRFINAQGNKAVSDGRGYTNIVSAFDRFKNLIIPNHKNYMFLYTDGANENPNTKKPSAEYQQLLLKKIATWDSNIAKDKQVFGFYVLVDQAADKDHQIEHVSEGLNKFHVVKNANVSIKIIGFPDEYPYNVYDRDKLDKNNPSIGITGDYSMFKDDVVLEATDSLYNLSFKPNIGEGWVEVNITPKRENIAEGVHCVNVKVTQKGNDPYSFVENPFFTIKCINKREHVAEVNLELESGYDNSGRTSYYPRFLYKQEKVRSQKAFLNVSYNTYAEQSNNSFCLSFVDGDGNPLTYNDFKIVANGDTLSSIHPYINVSGSTSIPLEFLPSTDIGDKHFAGYIVVSNVCGIDRINGNDMAKDNQIAEWNFRHDRQWNPLKILSFWIFILIIVMLFARILYSHLRKGIYAGIDYLINDSLEVLVEKRTCNRIILSSKPKRQSTFDWLFNGKTLYSMPIKGLTSEIKLNAAGRKGSIMCARFCPNKEYLFDDMNIQKQIISSDDDAIHTISDMNNNLLLEFKLY